MKTPEEILSQPKYAGLKNLVLICEAMEEYASQELQRLSKEKEELEKILGIIRERNFARMLEKVSNGIIHRADTYNTPDQFEDNGTYEEYARYIGPAQGKLIDAFIEQALNTKE